MKGMTSSGYTLFETPIGTCGLAWSERGICGLQLPGASAAATRSRLARRWPKLEERAPPDNVVQVVARIRRLLAGERIDLGDIALDLEETPVFHRKVYEAARAVPPGETVTYGEIARRLGAPQESREVGQALGRNPVAIIVPCHRVLAADGKMGGFSAPGGVATKRRMLEIEGAAALSAGPLFAQAR